MIYQVQAPDGSIHEIEGPEGASPDEVISRAQSLVPSTPSQTAPAPVAPPKAMSREDAIKAKAREQVASNTARRDALLSSGDKVSARSLSDLVTGGDSGSKGFLATIGDMGAAAGAGGANFLGIGPRIQAGISALKDGVPYDDALTYYREVNRLNRDKSLVGDIAGSLVTGGGAIKAGGAALEGLTAVAPKIGNVLTKAVALEKGQKASNAAKIVVGGAASGAAQAAGEGTDIGKGAATGAVAAPAAVLGLKGAAGLVRKVGRKFGNNVDKALQEVVKESPDAIAARQAQLSRSTGENVPVIAALDDGDFGRFTDKVMKVSEPANKIAKTKTGEQINGFMKRMEGHVKQAGATAQRSFDRTIRNPDKTPILDASGNPMSLPASGAINDLTQLRDDTVDQMIAPIRDNPLNLGGLRLAEDQRRVVLSTARRDPKLADPIKTALIDGKPSNATVGQLDALRRNLRKNAKSARAGNRANEAASYDNAAEQVRRFIEKSQPEYKPAMDVYAAHSKMLNGFDTATKGQRISDVKDPSLSRDLHTNEGRVGMMLGELHRQREAVGKSPSSAIKMARDYGAEGKLTRQADPLDPTASQPGTITENLSPTSAADLADASRAQYEVLQRMTKAGGIDVAEAGKGLDSPDTLSYGLALASGGGGPIAKAHFMNNLVRGFPTQINDKVAKNMTEMLFSGDAAQSQQALRALKRLGITDQVLRSMVLPAAAGATSARGDSSEPPTMIDVGSGQIIPNPDTSPGPQSDAGSDLADRVEMAESGGRVDAVSDKGAEGPMQIMPATGPDAAKLAGEPYDRERIKTDGDYNRRLGRAYLKEMQRIFKDDELALVAYNWGMGNLQNALDAGKDWRDVAPQETRDYVDKILG